MRFFVMQPTVVVAALIVRDEKIFIQKRGPSGALPNLWEFPGGKVEAAESHAQALTRECQEELGVEVIVGRHLYHSRVATQKRVLSLHLYWAQLKRPEDLARVLVASEGLWAPVTHLDAYLFCPADVPVVRALFSGALPLFGAWPHDGQNA